MSNAEAANFAGCGPSVSRTLPYRPPGMKRARASMSAERRNMLRTTAARTNHGAGGPIAAQATPPMKNAEQPSSVNARVAARQTETYEISVLDARTTGTRGVGGNLAMGASRLYSGPADAGDAPGRNPRRSAR